MASATTDLKNQHTVILSNEEGHRTFTQLGSFSNTLLEYQCNGGEKTRIVVGNDLAVHMHGLFEDFLGGLCNALTRWIRNPPSSSTWSWPEDGCDRVVEVWALGKTGGGAALDRVD